MKCHDEVQIRDLNQHANMSYDTNRIITTMDKFSSSYIVLGIFAVSMLWQNLLQFVAIKSWSRNYLNFWRSYDLVMHIGLSLALIFRAIRVNDVDETLANQLDRGEVVLFANITTMALIRYHWF